MATDIFLALKAGIRFQIMGECRDEMYRNWIEVLSFDIDTDFDASQLVHQSGSVKNRAKLLAQQLGGRFGSAPTSPPETEEPPLRVFYFKVTKYVDRASPFLFVNYCQSASKDPVKIPTAFVTIRKSGRGVNSEGIKQYGMAYLKYEFANSWVVQYSIDHDASLNVPKETIRFCCSSYYMRYTPQTEEGEKDAPQVKELGWDFEKNQPASPRS